MNTNATIWGGNWMKPKQQKRFKTFDQIVQWKQRLNSTCAVIYYYYNMLLNMIEIKWNTLRNKKKFSFNISFDVTPFWKFWINAALFSVNILIEFFRSQQFNG